MFINESSCLSYLIFSFFAVVPPRSSPTALISSAGKKEKYIPKKEHTNPITLRVRELISKRRRPKPLNISARDSLYSRRRSETRREARERGERGPGLKRRQRSMRRKGKKKRKCAEPESVPTRRRRTDKERERERGERFETVRKTSRCAYLPADVDVQAGGRLILLHVMQIPKSRPPSRAQDPSPILSIGIA